MKNSPLAAKHLQRNAKMADFGGWLMPIEYPSSGVIAEYVVDDLIVYRNSDTDLFLVPNASNTAAVFEILKASAPTSVEVKNLHTEFGVIAVQGPDSVKVLNQLGIKAEMDYMAFVNTEIDDSPIILCRTGYTGELGFEIIPRWADAEKVWDKLVEVVEKLNGTPCGLGARDILRTEMGYPLHGHELSLQISPVEAAAGWAVGWSKAEFKGRKVLSDQKENGTKLKLKAILSLDRGIPRKDMQVKNLSGEVIGVVTSGTFSPGLKKGIGLALINSEVIKGDNVLIDVRGTDCQFEVVGLPFVPSKVR